MSNFNFGVMNDSPVTVNNIEHYSEAVEREFKDNLAERTAHFQKHLAKNPDYEKHRLKMCLAAAKKDGDGFDKLVNVLKTPDPVDAWGNTPLIYAVCGHDMEVIKFLIHHGSNPHKKFDGKSAYTIAQEVRFQEAVELFERV